MLSRKIDRLEQISGLIFKEVEEHPEKRNSIRTFFDYYLPTTQKLLDTYADFEDPFVASQLSYSCKVMPPLSSSVSLSALGRTLGGGS